MSTCVERSGSVDRVSDWGSKVASTSLTAGGVTCDLVQDTLSAAWHCTTKEDTNLSLHDGKMLTGM